ncbi:hypothetical protein ACFFRR_008078 [Megaselia abdita]
MKVYLLTSILCFAISNVLAANEFVLLHNNDMHGRFEQVSATSGTCWKELAAKNLCYGGFARVANIVRKFRNESEVIYLNAGDTFTGTIWFTVFRAKIAAAFMNILSPDAMCLGNHEFIDGEKGLFDFLDLVEFPVLAANINFRGEQPPQSLRNSHVIQLNGTKVGIIGAVTPQTRFLSNTKFVNFTDEVEAINKESKKLTAEGIKIIIALVHSGFTTDKIVALNCPEVDIVVGGHTNTFLSNNSSAPHGHPEKIEGNYPTIITQKSGRQVYVVQAAAFTKYIGKATVKFDDEGELIHFEGQPILLDSSIPQDQDVLELLNTYRPKITELENEHLATTKVTLEGGKICRKRECIIGNILTEAMVYSRVKIHSLSNNSWTDSSIAFYNGGGIRSAIELQGPLTSGNVMTGLPFQSRLYMVEVHGSTILKALEHSAEVFTSSAAGGFLQMYGAKVVYNMNSTVGQRVSEVLLLCSECDIPKYEKLQEEKKYKIIITDFLHNGGDKYVFKEKDNQHYIDLSITDSDVFIDFVRDQKILYPTLDGRISFTSAGITLQSNCFVIIVITLAWSFFQ